MSMKPGFVNTASTDCHKRKLLESSTVLCIYVLPGYPSNATLTNGDYV